MYQQIGRLWAIGRGCSRPKSCEKPLKFKAILDACEHLRTGPWCPGAESNHRHRDFQSRALPTELPGPASRTSLARRLQGASTRTRPGRQTHPLAEAAHRSPAARPAELIGPSRSCRQPYCDRPPVAGELSGAVRIGSAARHGLDTGNAGRRRRPPRRQPVRQRPGRMGGSFSSRGTAPAGARPLWSIGSRPGRSSAHARSPACRSPHRARPAARRLAPFAPVSLRRVSPASPSPRFSHPARSSASPARSVTLPLRRLAPASPTCPRLTLPFSASRCCSGRAPSPASLFAPASPGSPVAPARPLVRPRPAVPS